MQHENRQDVFDELQFFAKREIFVIWTIQTWDFFLKSCIKILDFPRRNDSKISTMRSTNFEVAFCY